MPPNTRPETSVSELLVYRARPTVRIDDQEYARVSELLVAMQMTEAEGGLSALELRMTNVASDSHGGAALAFEDDKILRLGARISVHAGEETNPQEIFRGLISGLEANVTVDQGPELIVLAEDAFQRARMQRRTRVHEDVSIADLAKELANQLGLTPHISGFTDTIGTQVQLNESDLAFLRRLLARYDGDLQVVGGDLQLSPRADVQRGTLNLAMYGQLSRARVLADLAQQVTAVTVVGWDVNQGQRVQGRGTGGHLGPGSGRTGASLVQDAIGERIHHVSHLAVTNDAEARALADAAFAERARRLVCLDATTEGNAALRVGTHVNVSGLGPRFDNTYYVVRACHHYDRDHGYQTTFEAECAYLGEGDSA